MKSEKPGKRVIFYWFVEYGFFFLITSFFVSATVLKYTQFYTLTFFFLQMTVITIILSLAYLIYKWIRTEYLFLNKHLCIKKNGESYLIPYKMIRRVGYYGNLLQHVMGTTDVVIKTKENKKYYMNGVKDYDELENELLSRMHS